MQGFQRSAHLYLPSTGSDFTSPEAPSLILHSRADFMSVGPVQVHRVPHSAGPCALGLMLYSHHLPFVVDKVQQGKEGWAWNLETWFTCSSASQVLQCLPSIPILVLAQDHLPFPLSCTRGPGRGCWRAGLRLVASEALCMHTSHGL